MRRGVNRVVALHLSAAAAVAVIIERCPRDIGTAMERARGRTDGPSLLRSFVKLNSFAARRLSLSFSRLPRAGGASSGRHSKMENAACTPPFPLLLLHLDLPFPSSHIIQVSHLPNLS